MLGSMNSPTTRAYNGKMKSQDGNQHVRFPEHPCAQHMSLNSETQMQWISID